MSTNDKSFKAYTEQTPTLPATNDLDQAAIVWWDGNDGTTPVTVDVDATGVLVVIGSVTTTVDYATYTTMGAVLDKINSLRDTTFGAGIHISGVACRRDMVMTGNNVLLAGAAQNLLNGAATGYTGKVAGVSLLYDTSTNNTRHLCIGAEAMATLLNGSAAPAGARSSSPTMMTPADPIYGNTQNRVQPFSIGSSARIRSLSAVATTAGAVVWYIRISKCSQTEADITAWTSPSTASATAQNLSLELGGEDGIVAGPNRRLVIEMLSAGAITEATARLSPIGDIGQAI